MRTYLIVLLVGVSVLLFGCNAQQPAPAPAQPAAVAASNPGAPPYQTTATVKDIMDGIVDPSADFIWDSVATIVSAKGTEDRQPRTPEEWKEVRRAAIRLLEATNLLMIPGRKVAHPGEKADDEKIELTPERIQTSLDGDRASWYKHAGDLHEATMAAFNAIEAKKPEDLLNAGDGIDKACENCHLQYWYPDDAARQNALNGGLSEQKK